MRTSTTVPVLCLCRYCEQTRSELLAHVAGFALYALVLTAGMATLAISAARAEDAAKAEIVTLEGEIEHAHEALLETERAMRGKTQRLLLCEYHNDVMESLHRSPYTVEWR